MDLATEIRVETSETTAVVMDLARFMSDHEGRFQKLGEMLSEIKGEPTADQMKWVNRTFQKYAIEFEGYTAAGKSILPPIATELVAVFPVHHRLNGVMEMVKRAFTGGDAHVDPRPSSQPPTSETAAKMPHVQESTIPPVAGG